MRIQESSRESGTQDSPRQDENSQQPEQHEFRHKKEILKSMNEHRNIDKERKREICGSQNLVPPTRDTGNQEQDQSSFVRPSTNTDKN